VRRSRKKAQGGQAHEKGAIQASEARPEQVEHYKNEEKLGKKK